MENFKKYYKYGNEAEKRFVKSLQVYGFKNKKSSDHDDINNHWDYLVNFPFKVDVKSSKRLNKENIHPSDAYIVCLLYTSPSPRDATLSRMPSSA